MEEIMECINCKYYDCGEKEYPCDECKFNTAPSDPMYGRRLVLWKPAEAKDMVNHPSHYETGKFECIDVMIETQGVEAVKHFCICNAFKYLYRHSNKNGTEDIKKAIWYLNKYVELDGDDR